MKISFHGAAREVTGACTLLKTDSGSSILVDCGLFQGSKEFEDMNFEPFGFDPKGVDALFVTHGHLDHIGRIPKLVKEGFRGPIFSTPPTKELGALILEDALGLAMREKKEFYGPEDLDTALSLWQEVPYHTPRKVGDLEVKFFDAGHILGSSLVEIRSEGKRLLISGDLGNIPSALLHEPEILHDVEYLVVESTYGNRVHEEAEERALRLERAVEDAVARRGTLMIPAFATERTQDILFLFNRMLYEKRIPEVPIFVDAPLAIRITRVFEKHHVYYRDEIQNLYRKHPHLFQFKCLKFTESVEESKKINEAPSPKVIIAGSGMMSGGRILHHARRYLSDPRSILLIIGFQAAGSLGRRLLDGVRMVKLFGEEISVEAEIRKINGFSAHADNPQLFSLVEASRDSLKKVFVIHGEKAQALHFSGEIKDRLGIEAVAPALHQEFEF